MLKDFKNWFGANKDLIKHLQAHETITYYYVEEILESLAFLSDIDEKLDPEIMDAFEKGYMYLYNYFEMIKTYLKNDFDNNFHDYIKYDSFIHYSIYLDDISNALKNDSKKYEIAKGTIKEIEESIEKVISERTLNEKLLEEYDYKLESVVEANIFDQTVPGLFVRIHEALEL